MQVRTNVFNVVKSLKFSPQVSECLLLEFMILSLMENLHALLELFVTQTVCFMYITFDN